MPAAALAQEAAVFEVKLDIDRDGKPDRAVVRQVPGEAADLAITLGKSNTDRPDVARKALTEDRVIDVQATPAGSLAITACFGCGANESTEEMLTIVYRGGRFLVGGYSRNWDWNQQTSDGVKTTLGGCDINYLSGKGTVSKGLDEGKPIKGSFKPVPLKDWSAARRPKACNF